MNSENILPTPSMKLDTLLNLGVDLLREFLKNTPVATTLETNRSSIAGALKAAGYLILGSLPLLSQVKCVNLLYKSLLWVLTAITWLLAPLGQVLRTTDMKKMFEPRDCIA